MTERLYNISKDQNETSNGLLNDIRKRSSLNRMYEKQSLALKKKLVEERKKAYDAASRKQGEGKGGLGFLRDLFLLKFLRGRGRGGGGFGRGGGARPPVGPTGGGLGIAPRITPKNNIVPFSRGRVPTRLGGLSRVGPLAILGTGLDFTGRLGSGQNVLQASLGAGGGLAGALAGGAKGAALGSFAGPIGTLIGGVGGSLIGGLAGGSIADLLSGANRRRGEELERVTLMSRKTEFSKASDDFDVVLDKFEGDTAPMMKSMKSGTEEAPSTGVGLPTPPAKPKFWTAGRIWDTVLFAGELLLFAAAVLSPFEGVAGDIGAGALVTRRLAKIFGKNSIKNFSRKGFSVPRSTIFRRGGSSKRTFSFRDADIAKDMFTGARVTVGSGSTPASKVIRNISKKDITERIFRQRALNESGGLSKFFRDTKNIDGFLDRKFLDSLPGMSRVGKIRRQGANELFQTRLDNLLESIRNPNLNRNRQAGEAILKNIKTGKNPWEILKSPTKVKKFRQLDIFKKIESDPDSTFIRSLVERETGTYIRPFTPPNPIRPIQGSSITSPTGQVSKPLKEIIQNVENLPYGPKPKKEGGRVEAGKPYIVGEIGKELFVPDASGDIIPNEDLPSTNLLVINREPETVIVPQVIDGSSDTPIVSNTVNPYDVVAKYAQMTGLFTV